MKPLNQIQNEIAEWAKRNFGNNVHKVTGAELGSIAPLLGIMEETGELAHCVLKRAQGIRGYDSPDKYRADRDDAISDILVYLCDFSAREGVDLLERLNSVWSKVQKRDWEKNPQNAHQIVEGDLINNEAAVKHHSLPD